MKKIIIFTVALLAFVGNAYAVVPENSAVSAILIEANDGRVIYEDNAHEERAMASITKIMTTLLTIESGNLDEPFVLEDEEILAEGTAMGLRLGDTVTKRALCYGMLLPSGNDSANAAAIRIAGSIDAFAEMMNQKATQIGMTDTHFVTPSGLDANGHYTTAYDMALLTRQALKNHIFSDICGLTKATVRFGAPPKDITLYNSNKMLKNYDGCIGVKTGFTDNARRTLVSAATRNGVTLICVTLSDSNDWEDHTNLLDYGFEITKSENISADLSDCVFNVVGGEKGTVDVKASDDFHISTINGELPEYKTRIMADNFLYAPVKEGDIVGRVECVINNEITQTIPILATQDIPFVEKELTFTDKIKEYIKQLF